MFHVPIEKILNYLSEEVFSLTDEATYRLTKLIDKKSKISAAEFKEGAEKIVGEKHIEALVTMLNAQSADDFIERAITTTSSEILGMKDVQIVLEKLKALGITNIEFDPTLARGFDYYTGIVFEVFDVSPINASSRPCWVVP